MAGKDLDFNSRNCWDVYKSKKDRKAIDDVAARYLDFISTCKTERQCVARILKLAAKAGFKESANGEDFKGAKVMRAMRGKTLLLARKGKRPLSDGVRLLGAHVDSPRLDFKQHPFYADCGLGMAKTHYYGGIRKHQWLARPLALHGVVATKDGSVVEVSIGEDPGDPVFTVQDLLPHLASQQMEKKLSKAFDAEKLNVVVGHAPDLESAPKKRKAGLRIEDKHVKTTLLNILHERYGIVEEDFFSAEMEVVPAGAAREVGLDRALMGGYGHDDRLCVFAALEAMLTAPAPEHCQLAIFWDKEEIGSEGSTGAKSRFTEYCLEDLILAWSPKARPSQVWLNSKAISGDVHPAMDPDYKAMHEELNAALLGHGPVMCKFTGHRGKVAANDAHAEYVGWMRGVLGKAGVPWQMAELGKVDRGGGGTVAKYLAEYGLDIVDMGPSVLSMHSPFEIASKVDLYATMLAYKAFIGS